MTTIPLTQTEEIVWHKYPEEKPPDDEFRCYLLEVVSPYFKDGALCFSSHEFIESTYYPMDKMMNFPPHWDNEIRNRVIIAWAELPKGWQENEHD